VLGVARTAGRLLWANPGRLIVLVAGAISVALATSGIVLAASTSLVMVRQTVDAGWRGTYDLLVRPADAPSFTLGGHDLVPLDYLGLRTSGITRIGEPALVLADEPTGNLDSRTAGQVIDLLLGLQDRDGFALVVATHDERLADRLDSRVTLLDGRLVNGA
jgi:hypothetical protein